MHTNMARDCGHTSIFHDGNVDQLHDGHAHHPDGDHVKEHAIDVSATNPDACDHGAIRTGHDARHVYGPTSGDQAILRGDHVDYLVNGRLHHRHGDHCDD